jgi:hypothetical protein
MPPLRGDSPGANRRVSKKGGQPTFPNLAMNG